VTDAATTTKRPAGVPAAARPTEPSLATRVQQTAAEAAEGVPGVHHLGSPTGRALVRAMGRVPGGRTTYGPGVSVEVGERKAAVDVSLVLDYGSSAPTVGEQVRETVLERVKAASGLEVVEVNVNVIGLHHPDDDVPAEPLEADEPEVGDAVATDDAVPVDAEEEREAGEEVQRIVAQAVEEGTGPDGQGSPGSRDETADAAAPDGARDDGRAPTVVLDVGSDDAGPDVVVAEQVVVADSVVVVDPGHDDPTDDTDAARERQD
jgi:uncharacterized alkaline shock family protein YloU